MAIMMVGNHLTEIYGRTCSSFSSLLIIIPYFIGPSKGWLHSNLLLDRLVGSEIILCPQRKKEDIVKQDGTLIKGMDTIMEEYAQFLRLENISSLGLGEKPLSENL